MFIFGKCQNPTEKSSTENIDSAVLKEKMRQDLSKVKKVFYSLPSPHEVSAILIEQSNTKYNAELLNPTKNYANYSSNKSIALNLGIYTTDLSYANLFGQNQMVVNCLATSKKLAENLGILNSIADSTINKLKEKTNDKEAVINIISESFMNSDAYLKENRRPEIAAMIVIGGWLEALYISTQLTEKNTTKNPVLVNKIIDQSINFPIITGLLNEYKENSDILTIAADMKSLEAIFLKVQNLQNEKKLDKTAFKELCDKIEFIRNSYVK